MAIHPLQTPEWAEFRKKWGNEVVQTPYGYLTLHKIPHFKYKIGMFIKCPAITTQILEYFKKFAKDNKLIFIKLEPGEIHKSDSNTELTDKVLKSFGAVRSKPLFNPETFLTDLTKSEEDLLKSFHPKTRYNIRYAQRKGVTVEESREDKAFEKYLELMNETVIRDKFFAHNQKYHRLMWETLKEKIAHLLIAKYNGEIVTTWILFAHDGVLYYPYGASTHKYKNVMASNLMMWEAIRLGKRLGLHTFDLWGRDPGKGFTKFKEGYNPKVVEFQKTWDLVNMKPAYKLYRTADKVRWLLLHLQADLGLTKYRF